MGLIEITKGVWINVKAIEAIFYKSVNECIVLANGRKDNYVASYSVEELIDILEAHGVEIVPFKRQDKAQS